MNIFSTMTIMKSFVFNDNFKQAMSDYDFASNIPACKKILSGSLSIFK